MLRPVGRWSSQFATETKFGVDLHIPHVERAVTRFLGQRFREFRYRLHKFYKKVGSDRRRREKPYDGVSLEDWEKITMWFETDKFKVKKLSVQNKGKCAKKVVHHRSGSKSFSNYREEKLVDILILTYFYLLMNVLQRDPETRQEPSRIEFYRMMYFNAGKGWASHVAEENYVINMSLISLINKMLEIKFQPLEEGSEPWTEDEIAEMVLSKKPGYNRGPGHGVEPISYSSAYRNYEVEELRRRAKAAERHAHESEQRAEELTTRLVETDLRFEELQSWKAASKSKLEFLMLQFAGSHVEGEVGLIFEILKLGKKGGGQLNVQSENWVTAPFNLTSHMTLFLAEDAIILGAN
ncbi:hypothetical protein IFM89_029824, partial [Coptis chinensis]